MFSDPTTLYIALGFAAFWVAPILLFYAAGILHELGHYLAARLSGARVSSCGFGYGRRLLQFALGPTQFFLAAGVPGGHTAWELPSGPRARVLNTLIVAAGPLTNILNAVLAWALITVLFAPHPSSPEHSTLQPFLYLSLWFWIGVNLFLVACSLIPFQRLFGVANDVDLLIQLLTGRVRVVGPAAKLNWVRQGRSKSLATIDPAMARRHLLEVANVWGKLQNYARAESCYHEALKLSGPTLDQGRAYDAYLRGSVLMALRQWDAAQELLEPALAQFANAHPQPVTVSMTIANEGLGDDPAALQDLLTRLDHDVAKRPAAHSDSGALGVSAFRCYLLALLKRRAEAEAEFAKLDAKPQLQRSDPILWLHILQWLARARFADGDLPAALAAYRRAVEIVRKLKNQLPSREDREELLLTQEDLRMEATACCLKLGQAKEVENIDRVFRPKRG